MATVWDLWLRRTKFAVAGPTSDRHGRSNPPARVDISGAPDVSVGRVTV